MTCHPSAAQLPYLSAPGTHHSPQPNARTGFATHKYLMVAILKCLQEKHPARPAPPQTQRGDPTVHRWMREPSAAREITPCIVLREHRDRHDLSVTEVALANVDVQARSLASWIRSVSPASSLPDLDNVHLAMAPTLPGVPTLVHSVGADGAGLTHMFNGGAWSLSEDDQFLLQAIRYARMVATAVPMSGSPLRAAHALAAWQATVPEPDGGQATSPLLALGQRYDHIAVHAALSELGDYRRDQRRVRVAPPARTVASGG